MPPNLPDTNRDNEGAPIADRYRSLDGFFDLLMKNQKSSRNRAIQIVEMEKITDTQWQNFHTNCDAYQKEGDEQKAERVTSLMTSLFPDATSLNMSALTEMALLFSEDQQAFIKMNVQCLFEKASDENAGMSTPQLDALLSNLASLESQSQTPQIRYQLHLILDFLIQCMEWIEIDGAEETMRQINSGVEHGLVSPGRFCNAMGEYASDKRSSASDYLLSRKYQDIYELRYKDEIRKPDTLYGVHGASSDESIYTFKRALENYKVRTSFDYYHGYPNRNPVFPIAPGYLAEYADGQIMTVFEHPKQRHGSLEATMIQKNDPTLSDYIYEKLNTPIEKLHGGTYKNHNPLYRGVNRLQDIWDFHKKLKDTGQEFVYDFSKIDSENLHPIVIGDLITRNNEVLKHHAQAQHAQLIPISKEEVLQKIFPGGQPSKQEIYNWKMLSSLSIRKKVEDDFGIDIADYEPWIMRLFLEFLDSHSTHDIATIKKYLASGDKKAKLIALTASSKGRSLQAEVLALSDKGQADELFREYAHLSSTAEKLTQSILSLESSLSFHTVFQSLVSRGSYLLQQAHDIASIESGDAAIQLQSLVKDIRKETGLQSVARSFFLSLSNALASGENISLQEYERQQSFILKYFGDIGLGAVLLKALQSKQKLEPIPEIHWRVDRTSKEYERRFGFDVPKFLEAFAKDHKQILLELGPGNGTFKHERGPLTDTYLDVALCDKLYYPLAPLIEKAIDFDKLEKDIDMPLPPHERKLLCDFLYKILIIQDGDCASDQFVYDTAVQKDCANDPSKILQHLIHKAPLLEKTDVVPNTISSRDEKGNVVYKSKVQKLTTDSFAKTCASISKNPATYISTDSDVYSMIPAYPAGTMVGDFGMLKNLKDKQLDAVIGVRSTVYIRGKQYTDLIATIADKLTDDGVWIDDSIRDNDGWYYRLHEAREAQQTMKSPIYVITGPGFPTEDYRQDYVPMALVITKSKQKLDYIRSTLQEGYALQTLDELTHDATYLKTLDATGHVLETVRQK